MPCRNAVQKTRFQPTQSQINEPYRRVTARQGPGFVNTVMVHGRMIGPLRDCDRVLEVIKASLSLLLTSAPRFRSKLCLNDGEELEGINDTAVVPTSWQRKQSHRVAAFFYITL